jgi:cobalamin biosynthesis protein CbiG
MEARVAILEQIAKSTAEALTDIKADLRSMRDKHDSDFRMTFAAGTAAVLGVVALMAKGFRWF